MRFAAMSAMGIIFLVVMAIGQNQDYAPAVAHSNSAGTLHQLGRGTDGSLSWPLQAASDGTVAAPVYSFANEPSLGIYRKGAGQMGLAKDLVFNRLVSSSTNTPQTGGSILLGQTDAIKAYWTGSSSTCGGTPCINVIAGVADGTVKVGDRGGAVFPGPINLPGNPSTNLQAATKQYVDNAISGVTASQGFVSPPSTPTSTCKPGTWSADANYHYDCYATNSWNRVAKDGTWSSHGR